MRIAIIAESFLPHMNGVTHSVLQVLKHLATRGDDVLIVAPAPGATGTGRTQPLDLALRQLGEAARIAQPERPRSSAGLHHLPAFPIAGYPKVRVAVGGVPRVKRLLAGFAPDVVYLASPFILGWRAAQAATQLNIPVVAVYQTEVPSYAGRYGVPFLEAWAWQRVVNIHNLAALTLAPSTFAQRQLESHGVERVQLWRRGVDAERFHPSRRSAALRASWAPQGEKLVGFVGRLAVEKQVEDLKVLHDLPGTRLVIIGTGPQEAALKSLLPNAVFTGFLGGTDLAEAVASLDLFVHPGELETFCQTIQEAMASGVPVVATGRGGPLDLVENSRTGWLYPPGDLATLKARVMDLLGDDAKRLAFGTTAFETVQGRTWDAISRQLVQYFQQAISTSPAAAGHARHRGRVGQQGA